MRKAGLPLIRESIKKQDGNLAKALSTQLPVAAEQTFSILPPGPLSHLGVHPAPGTRSFAFSKLTASVFQPKADFLSPAEKHLPKLP